MGLFVVSEIVKRTAGRFLIASRGGSLYIEGDPEYSNNHTLKKSGAEYDGTLVAFEFPLIGPDESPFPEVEFKDILAAILDDADALSPGRADVEPVFVFEQPLGDATHLLAIMALGDLEKSASMRQSVLRAIVDRRLVVVDFLNVGLATQSQGGEGATDEEKAAECKEQCKEFKGKKPLGATTCIATSDGSGASVLQCFCDDEIKEQGGGKGKGNRKSKQALKKATKAHEGGHAKGASCPNGPGLPVTPCPTEGCGSISGLNQLKNDKKCGNGCKGKLHDYIKASCEEVAAEGPLKNAGLGEFCREWGS